MIHLKDILKEVYFNGFSTSDCKSKFPKPENFDKYGEGKGWTAWRGKNEGDNGCTFASVMFNEGSDEQSRMWFKIKYPESINKFVGEATSTDNPVYKRVNSMGKRISNKWIREAQRIHRIPKDYFPDGKSIKRDWKECFVMALGSAGMKSYVSECGIDYTKWNSMRRAK